VAAAADGHLQAVFARQVHGVHHIRRVPAARDQGGPFVDQTVVHAPRLVVTDVERLEELSTEARRELVQASEMEAGAIGASFLRGLRADRGRPLRPNAISQQEAAEYTSESAVSFGS
jgi:hypothetical protein